MENKTMRDEMIYFDGVFRNVMATKTMCAEDHTTFQYALDSIEYILASQNWLDDEWVWVGFQNIEKAKKLLKKYHYAYVREDGFVRGRGGNGFKSLVKGDQVHGGAIGTKSGSGRIPAQDSNDEAERERRRSNVERIARSRNDGHGRR